MEKIIKNYQCCANDHLLKGKFSPIKADKWEKQIIESLSNIQIK